MAVKAITKSAKVVSKASKAAKGAKGSKATKATKTTKATKAKGPVKEKAAKVTKVNTSTLAPAKNETKALVPQAGSGGGAGEPPKGLVPSSGSASPSKRGGQSLTPTEGTAVRRTAGPRGTGRREKFMGNAQVVPNERLSGPKSAPANKSNLKRNVAMGAGGILAGAAALYSSDRNKKASTTKPPMAAQKPLQSVVARTPTNGPAKQAPAFPVSSAATPARSVVKPAPATPKPSSTTKPAQPKQAGGGKKMQGEDLANFLGLSKDSAVRYYMKEGKHKYPSKAK